MDSSSQQPEPENKKEDRRDLLQTLERQKLRIFAKDSDTLPLPSSLGEYLLPILFAAMETCWYDAIFIGLASFGLFQSHKPLMPLWSPFVLIAGSYWFIHRLDSQAASTSTSSRENNKPPQSAQGSMAPAFILLTVVIFFIIWLSIYSQAAFLFDPRWLLALLNDILFLNGHFYQAFCIVALSLYFCWRGIRLSNHEIEPSHVFNTLRLGLGVMIAVILVQSGQANEGTTFNDELTLILLIPLFLFLALAAHALARVGFVRRFHPGGLQGSVEKQERAIITMIATIGLILLLVALLIGSIASPTFLVDAQHTLAPVSSAMARAYDLLVEGVAWLAVLIATPFFWLFSLLLSILPSRAPKTNTPPTRPPAPYVPPTTSHVVPVVIPFLKIILPILIFLAMVFLIRWALRKRYIRRMIANRRNEETSESVWSWSLFWTQLKSLLRSLFARFLPRHPLREAEQGGMAVLEGEPTARTIREIYRALLKRAATRGYARKKEETPYEFRQRLDEQIPLSEPELEVITEAYTGTRYGGIVPDEAEAAHVQRVWNELEQKWVADRPT